MEPDKAGVSNAMVVSAEPQTRAECEIARALSREEPALLSSLGFGPFVRQGEGPGPAVLIGDQSEIALMEDASSSPLEHRMALLARPGDHILLHRLDCAFETYLEAYLGFKNVTFHQVKKTTNGPLTRQVWTNAEWVERLATIARTQGGLTFKAYLTTGHTWRLAQTVGERARQVVHVSGPSPRMARRANDKLWFSHLARRLIGDDATPPTVASFGPAATAGLVKRTGRIAGQVVIKVPDSAGSAGNIRLDKAAICGRTTTELQRLLLDRLHATGWRDGYPVLVGVWDKDVICSPSVQMWIPLPSDGPPEVEGIFEQRVHDAVGSFVGAAPTTLPLDIQGRLERQAACIARVLQQLGYFGRCSLDAVLCKTAKDPALVHWIECNARWGGVSIPMTAAALIRTNTAPPHVSIAQELLQGHSISMAELLERLEGMLLRAGTDKSGIVIGSPPPHPKGAQINVFALAETQARADEILRSAMRAITEQHRA